jgi:hypothetical protein
MLIIIGSEKCPLMYYNEVAESYETELCNLDDSECPLYIIPEYIIPMMNAPMIDWSK